MLNSHDVAPHSDCHTKIMRTHIGRLRNLALVKRGTAQEFKPPTPLIYLEVGLRRDIRITMAKWMNPTDTMRSGHTKTMTTVMAMEGTEAGAKTGVEGGRPHNGHKGDQQRQGDTPSMTHEVEVYRDQNLLHLVEATTISRNRIIDRMSMVSHKAMNSIINQKTSTTMAPRKSTTVGMRMMNFRFGSREIGRQRSTTTVLQTTTARVTEIPNTCLVILSKNEEAHMTGSPLHAVIGIINLLDSPKRQDQGSNIVSPRQPGLQSLSIRNPVSWPKRDSRLRLVYQNVS